MANMSDYDITDGGRRRIVSEDQARNLREQAYWRQLLEDELAQHGRTACQVESASRLEEEDERWDRLGEESQDQGWA